MHFPTTNPDQTQILRTQFNALRRDANVDVVEVGKTRIPTIAELKIKFREGKDQPENQTLHALDKRFPVMADAMKAAVELETMPKLEPPPERAIAQEQTYITTLRMTFNTDDRKILSAEYSPIFQLAPAFAKVGSWIRDKISGRRFLVNRVILADPSSVVLHEWRTDADLMVVAAVDYIASDFEECDPPIEGLSAYERLMTEEDPFGD